MHTLGSIDSSGQTDWLAMATRTAHVAVGISSLRSGAFVEANESFCRLLRRTHDDIIGRTAAELGMWPDPQMQQRLVAIVQRQGSITRFEARYCNSAGEIGDVEISARIVAQRDEPFLIGFLTEVTDRRELIEGLRAAQTRLGIVLRSSNMLVFRQDRDLRYTWVANPALGATERDLIGRTDDEIMGAEAAAPLVSIKRRVLESGCPERRDVWVANKGHLGCFDLVVEPERDAAGRLAGIICAAQDVTQRMTAPGQAVRVPVNAIQGMASLIGREALTLRQKARLQRIDREAARLAGPPDPMPALQQLRERQAGALIVVAEGNPVLRELLQVLLEQAGLRVVAASSGVEAFSFTMQCAPDLLLLDMEMPQSGGVAAARAVRTMARHDLPIVAMLSASFPASAGWALDADLDDVLDKPVTAAVLYEKVHAWLESR
ncbi:MAG: PAS domain-containing protein [Burkholderiaceae bacterium]|nr:PAS domain-containing protein [Burkholderiaceae bacterium]